MYGFQFATNQQVSATVKIVSLDTLTAVAAAVLLAGVAAWVGWDRRVLVGWRRFGLLRGSGPGGDADGSDSAADGADLDDAEADPAGGFDSSPLP
jgi:hypothetical protein